MFSNDVSPIGVDEKNHPRYMKVNDILTGLDGKDWIIIVRNNIKIWKRVITNEFRVITAKFRVINYDFFKIHVAKFEH